MDKKELISQLESFISDCKEFVSVEPTENDVQALEVALEAMKRTTQEVPVQEQSLQIIAILSWRCANNYKSALRYDKETETILIDEERLMEVIQLITPTQKKRNIRVVKGLINKRGML